MVSRLWSSLQLPGSDDLRTFLLYSVEVQKISQWAQDFLSFKKVLNIEYQFLTHSKNYKLASAVCRSVQRGKAIPFEFMPRKRRY